MPVAFTQPFTVRHYECDAYGHLNNVNYIRYMQETALSASANIGWTMERYQQSGHHWLIRETDIQYLQPLLYNEVVDIKTWVADFRRAQSWRMYEFRRQHDQALIAQASTNWVYLNQATGQPARIPDNLIQDYMPDSDPSFNRPDKFPPAPPPPVGIFKLRKRVEWRDIDTLGHANNATYFSYFEDVSTQVGKHFGWSMARMQAEGFAMIMRQLRVVYHQPALMDDELEIACWLSDGKRATATRHYTIHRVSDGALLAEGRALWVCFDLKAGRPMRLPKALVDDFAPNTTSE